ncbi:MAG: ORF1 [Bat faecal associated dicistrovirus 1]|nr:MAG: ORF1 [Bat faecal associated dicistrovirus 1]
MEFEVPDNSSEFLIIAPVDIDRMEFDVDNNIVVKHFEEPKLLSLKQLAADKIKTMNLDKLSNVNSDFKLYRKWFEKVFELKEKLRFEPGPFTLILKLVEGREKPLTRLNTNQLILVSHWAGREVADNVFKNFLVTNLKVMTTLGFENKNYWRFQLLKFENSKYWFALYKMLYCNSATTGEFANRNKHGKTMKINITPQWYKTLQDIQFFEQKEAAIDIVEYFDGLILAGDVELNPGPVMSKFMRYNNSSMNKKHEAQGPVDEMRRLNDFLSEQLPVVIENIRNVVLEGNTSLNNTAFFIDEKIKEDLDKLAKNNSDHLAKLKGIQSNVLKTLVVLSLISILVTCKWYKTAMVISLVTLFSLFGIPEVLINQVKKLFSIEHEAEVFGNTTALGTLAGSIICYFIIGKLPTDSSIEQFSKKTSNISRGLTGMMNLHRDISKIWNSIKEFVISQIDPTPEGLMTMEQEMISWMKDIEYYVDIIIKKKCAIQNEQIIKISNLLKQGLQLRRWAFTNRCSPEVCINISNYIRTAEQLYNYADKNNTLEGGQRQRPLCIVLFGESQIGKSGLIYPLAQDLCYAAGYKEAKDIDEQIYARQPETEFWDGYKGQFIVVRDDCLAAIDDVSKPNPELHETIREMNDFPYHLHMAALEDKNSFYTSKVGIMTINDIRSPIKSLTYPEAFYNRIADNIYQVTPAPEFVKEIVINGCESKKTLDLEKVSKHLEHLSALENERVPITTDIYNFIKYKKIIKNGITIFEEDKEAPILNYNDFSKLMCTKLLKKQDDYVVKQEFMRKRLLKMQAQVNDDEFFECSQTVTDIISRRIAQGESLLDIECDLLNSDMAEDYINFKNGAQEYGGRYHFKLKYYSASMYESAVACIKTYFDKFRNILTNILDKYPALKYIFMIGSVALAMYAVYKAFFQEEKIAHFEIAEEIDEATFDRNSRWMEQQKDSLSFNDRMAYFKTNLMMRYPEEKETIDRNINGVAHFYEGIDSPSSGKQKHMQKHRIEVMQSPSSGKTSKIAKHNIESIHESEGSSDTNAMETAFTILKNNLYSLTYDKNGTDCLLGNVIALQGYNYLMPYHFVRYLLLNNVPLDTKLSLSRINYSEKAYNKMSTFKLSEIINDDESLNRAVQITYGEHDLDAIIFNISESSNVTLHRSILKHFIMKEELGRLRGNMQGLLLSYHNDNGQIAKVIKSLNDVHNYEQELQINLEGQSYIHRAGYLYNGDTMKGDCGGPLIIKANSLIRKIVGIHISGSSGEGYSAKLYQELLQDHIDKLSSKIGNGHRVHCFLEIDEDLIESEECKIPDGVFNEIGKARIPLRQATRSVLKPSLIHNQITEAITKPAYLKPFVKDDKVIDPAYKGLEKCGGVTPLIPINYCDMVTNYLKYKLNIDYKKVGYDSYARVLSYEEAIKGTDDTYMSAVCRSTSPGYPFNSDKQYSTTKPGKQQWMGSNEIFDFESDSAMLLRKIVQKLENDCLNGKITGVICADTMKDERRPIAKVDEGKTRMFAACPMHFVILFRKYYLGSAAFIMHNRNLNGIAVGTNPYSEDWDQIVRQISIKGRKVLAGDFSNYDGSLNTQVLWIVYNVIENFYKMNDPNYSDDHAKIRYSLWLHIINSVHIYGDNVYQWTHSQPSGNPFTVIINSIYNLAILVIAYLDTIDNSKLDKHDKSKLFNTFSFDKNISPIVYGDDNILNISDNISSIFNQETLTSSLAKLGHTYTEETKDGKMHLYRSLSEISFLKRKFVFDENVYHYVAPLDISVIYEMLNWVRGNSVDSICLLKSNIETALREISLHGFSEYSNFVEKLNSNKTIVRKVKPFIPTFGEVRSSIESMDPMSGFTA